MPPLLPSYITNILRRIWLVSKWYTAGWLVYYLICDTNRRLIIHFRASRTRSNRTDRLLGSMNSNNPKGMLVMPENQQSTTFTTTRPKRTRPVVSEEEKDDLRAQFAPVSFLGRYWNPFPEWREQGAWEHFAKWGYTLVASTLGIGSGNESRREEEEILGKREKIVKGRVGDGEWAKGLEVEEIVEEKLFPWGKDEKDVDPDDDRLTYTWIGQSTSYILLSRLRILTDPTFDTQTLPSTHTLSSIAPHRIRPLPCDLKRLGKIDLVLVSHDHLDHLSEGAVRELSEGEGGGPLWVVPSGLGRFLGKNGVSKGKIMEMSWWEVQEMDLNVAGGGTGKFRITCVPNMHWTARTPLDTNTTLSSCFLVESLPTSPLPTISTSTSDKPNTPTSTPRSRSFFHVGDTGYSETLFSAIGKVLDRSIDCGSVPIGSYEPRGFMKLHHTDPEGAVRIAQHLQIKKSFAAHWGTWIMSDEHYLKPPRDLVLAKKKLEMPDEEFEVIPPGRTITVD